MKRLAFAERCKAISSRRFEPGRHRQPSPYIRYGLRKGIRPAVSPIVAVDACKRSRASDLGSQLVPARDLTPYVLLK